jgi:geranylgeranyl diphosphate synthase, type II
VKTHAAFLELFNNRLNEYRAELEGRKPAGLYDSESYFLSLGGKRLRPVLALIACDLFGKDPRLALPSALAVELFHNFSLIHDDILDQAPLRRNQPTVHVKWNTSTAILSGDAILVKAFRALESHKPVEFRKLSTLLYRTAILVCEGQQLDMEFEQLKKVSVQDYIGMITGKTAVLLGCSLQMGAVSAAAGRSAQERLYEFGRLIGIAFQLSDDLLDAYADTTDFGKKKGGDILCNKKTFLMLKARELAKPAQLEELDRLMALGEDHEKEKLDGVLAIFDRLKVKDHCRKEADKRTRAAISCLGRLRAEPEKIENLKQLAYELLAREV